MADTRRSQNYFYKALFVRESISLVKRILIHMLITVLGGNQESILKNFKVKMAEATEQGLELEAIDPVFALFKRIMSITTSGPISPIDVLKIIGGIFVIGMGDNPLKWLYKWFTVPASLIIELVASGLRDGILVINIDLNNLLSRLGQEQKKSEGWTRAGILTLLFFIVVLKVGALVLQLAANFIAFCLHALNRMGGNLTNTYTIIENKFTKNDSNEKVVSWQLSESFKQRFPRTAALLMIFAGIAAWLGTKIITPNATGTLGTVIETITAALPSWEIAGVAILAPAIAKGGILAAAVLYATSFVSQTVDLYDEFVDMGKATLQSLKSVFLSKPQSDIGASQKSDVPDDYVQSIEQDFSQESSQSYQSYYGNSATASGTYTTGAYTTHIDQATSTKGTGNDLTQGQDQGQDQDQDQDQGQGQGQGYPKPIKK